MWLLQLEDAEQPLVERVRVVFAEHQYAPVVPSTDRIKGRVQVPEISRHDVLQVRHVAAAQVGSVVVVEVVGVQEVVL